MRKYIKLIRTNTTLDLSQRPESSLRNIVNNPLSLSMAVQLKCSPKAISSVIKGTGFSRDPKQL